MVVEIILNVRGQFCTRTIIYGCIQSEAQLLLETPLTALHKALGAKLVPFAGYSMPISYPSGIIAEHNHTRSQAGLFDVSHMGQIMVTGDRAAVELETLMPANLLDLSVGQSTYSLLTTLNGGVYDDLIVTRDSETSFYLVVNGACKVKDLELIAAGCPTSSVEMLEERALLALQGPEARPVIGAP